MYGDGAQLLDHASGGNDTLISAEGSDVIWGDASVVGRRAATGADLFVIPAGGHDQIMDFQPGKDHIELFSFASFQQLSPQLQDTGDGVLIAFGPNSDLLIRGVTAGQLSAGDFIFG
jgi:Ca2+-binding RTX toxin-like protein